MLDDHTLAILLVDRYFPRDDAAKAKFLKNITRGQESFFAKITSSLQHRAQSQKAAALASDLGLGPGDLGRSHKSGIADLEAVSAFLGSKTFVMGGERPTEVDCALYAVTSAMVHAGAEGSVFKALIERRLTNLNQHMKRMTVKVYPDWQELISGMEPETILEEQKRDGGKAEEKAAPPAKPPPPKAQQQQPKQEQQPKQQQQSTAKPAPASNSKSQRKN